MLLVVSETFTSQEHSLHDFFQTYLSDPLRHWFSDCNGPRHRTPGFTSDYVDAHHAMTMRFILIHKHEPHVLESVEENNNVSCLRREFLP